MGTKFGKGGRHMYLIDRITERSGVIRTDDEARKHMGCIAAAKMEEGIKKIEGVKNANVSFLLQKVVIEADTDNFDEIIEKASAVVKKVDPACKIIK